MASIGTGGSAIQYIPEIAPQVKQLYVMQRTAAWVIPRDERKYLNIEKNCLNKQTGLESCIVRVCIGRMNHVQFQSCNLA